MYIELHTASAFSFLQGASLPEALIDRAAALGYPALALLDRDGVYGLPRFHKAALAAGIRPIVGRGAVHSMSIASGADRPPRPTASLCRCSARRRGVSQSVPADDDDEAARAQGRGRADARRVRRQDQRARGACRDARRSMRGGSASAGCSIGSSACSDAISVYVDLQRHHRRDEEADVQALVQMAAAFRVPTVATNGVRFAQPVDRPLFDVLTCIHHHTDLAHAGRRLASNAERYLKPPDEMAALFADLPDAIARTGELADRLRLHDGRSRLSLSGLPGAARRDAGVVSPADDRGRRARSLPAVSRSRPRPDRARARSHREARSRRLLPDRLGHRQFLPAARHPRAGARLGGQQRRLLQPRHHRGRSGRHGSAVRALSVGRARRVAGHRSRSAERRPARAGHSARLREVRRAAARP